MANASFDLAKGSITIDTEVISKIAGIIATECYGVVGMAYRSKSDEFASLLKKDNITKGIRVSISDKTVNIDIHVIIQYGVNINAICTSIINSVKYQVSYMTGLETGDINVYVEGSRVQE